LRERGADVVPFRVYSWELPEDIDPLKASIRELSDRKVDVVLFTSSVQFIHALRVAQQMGLAEAFLEGLRTARVASIGPIASETLAENGVRIDLEASHPKMGFLVKETAEKIAARDK
jgi:uroporphyrinogen-III synthase